MKQSMNGTSPKSGMVRDTHISLLKPSEYVFAMNATTDNEQGERLNIQREPSNFLALKFTAGYKVIGYKLDLLKEITYFFLTNPTTKKSSIGYVSNKLIESFNTDTYKDCLDCTGFNQLGKGLETIVQIPAHTYIEIINDDCLVNAQKTGLNFNINFPIKFIEIKQEKMGTFLYWNDYRNRPRYLNVSDTTYLFEQGDPCNDPIITTCINIDRLLQAPKHINLHIEPTLLQTGGNLKLGTYEFYVTYCDQKGNEIVGYSTPTNPISIFDENNVLLEQINLDAVTNYAIKLQVKNLDVVNFKYYKVVVVQRTNVNNTQSYFVEGIHPTSDDTIIYSSEANKERIANEKLYAVRPVVIKAKGIVASNNIAMQWGLITRREVNLQPIANLIGGFVKWQTSVAKEDLYKSAIATSKYKGYMRDEVQPLAIRFLLKDGGTTPTFPLIARPPTASDLTPNVQTSGQLVIGKSYIIKVLNGGDNFSNAGFAQINTAFTATSTNPSSWTNATRVLDLNYASIDENTPDCTQNTREKRWQIYNTATVDGTTCTSFEDDALIFTEPVQKTCIIDNVFTIPTNTITLPLNQSYTNLKEYVEDNYAFVTNPTNTSVYNAIGQHLVATYPQTCLPNFEGDCKTPIFESQQNIINQVFGEQSSKTEKTIGQYVKNVPPTNCSIFKVNTTNGGRVEDTNFVQNFMPCGSTVYARAGNFTNEECDYAVAVVNNSNPTSQPQGYHHNYYGDVGINNLYTPINSAVTSGGFNGKIHKGASWFKIEKNNRNKIVFEITKQSNCESTESINSNELRYNFVADCSVTTSLGGAIINSNVGVITLLDVTLFPDTFYVVIDNPIVTTTVQLEPCTVLSGQTFETRYRTVPLCGCFGVLTRDIEYQNVNVSFSSITLNKTQTYKSLCDFKVPQVNGCDPKPYTKGTFAYWQSTQEYPNNKELFDSSILNIKETDFSILSPTQKDLFEDYYTTGNVAGKYNLKLETNFRCKNIRHFKFPDNNISPFLSTLNTARFSESLIFPLGISLDNKVVQAFLKIALNNNLLNQEEFDNIYGYEILKGDNTAQKSIIANGLGYDMYNYSENGHKMHYANFPFNDLGNDILHVENGNVIPHPFGGQSNNKFSVISPDLLLNKLSTPTEIAMSGFQLGNSRIFFEDVKEHSKWTILGEDAKKLADALATAEVVLELAIEIADANKETSIFFGLSNGGNIGGLIAAGLILTAYGIGKFIKAGRIRYQWLTTFRDLGAMENFASYSVSEGYHNKLLKNSNSNQYLRGISVGKNLKDYRRYEFLDEKSLERIKVNSFLREDSTFISLGNYNFSYPSDYYNYDNNVSNNSSSSKTVASQNGDCFSQKERNVGSPYFTLKNWIQDQYGALGSVRWLTTNYKNELIRDSNCETIFGGTVYISRFTWKRKVPMFTQTAFRLADRLPFAYTDYPNIAKPRYYCDYESRRDNIGGFDALFANLDSIYNFDCESSRNRMYIKKPNKFYLWYYGITNFLVESEINCNFRYGKREPKDQFYPVYADIVDWTQENLVSIGEPNKFFYNNVYSLPVSLTPYTFLDNTYNLEDYEKRRIQDNAVIISEPDNSENDFVDPWLIYKPLNYYEFATKYGKLIQLKDLESAQVLGRFENQQVIFNAVDSLADRITPVNKELGTGGIFATRPREFKATDLGYSGTQHSDMVSTPYGHFSVDAKRGKIFMIDQSGQQLLPISENTGQKESGLKNWFKEQLPFKILKDFPQVDIDNKFKSIGISMGWDARFERVFITKKDYVVKKKDCLKYDKEIGFYTDCNSTISCPEGYSYNSTTNLCQRVQVVDAVCQDTPEYKTTGLYVVIDPSFSISGDEIDIRNMTPQQIKCIMATQPIWGQSGLTGAYHFNPTLQVGDTLYAFNTLPLTVLGGLVNGTVNVLNNFPYEGNMPTSNNQTTDRIISLSNGVVTAITYFSNLPSC